MEVFYFILAILFALYYFFAAPPAIKGTLNLVLSVLAVVALIVFLMVTISKVIQSPTEIWVVAFLVVLALATMRDILRLPPKGKRLSQK